MSKTLQVYYKRLKSLKTKRIKVLNLALKNLFRTILQAIHELNNFKKKLKIKKSTENETDCARARSSSARTPRPP